MDRPGVRGGGGATIERAPRQGARRAAREPLWEVMAAGQPRAIVGGRRLLHVGLAFLGSTWVLFSLHAVAPGFASLLRGTTKAAEGADPGANGRRAALASLTVAGLSGVPLLCGGLPAAAAQEPLAWQLKLPRAFQVYESREAPPNTEKKAVPLVVAGDERSGGELVVLRVPLTTSPEDPNFDDSTLLQSYFGTPIRDKPKVSISEAVKALTKSQETQNGLAEFQLYGAPSESFRGGQRYVKYDYESALCLGNLIRGSAGNTCENPEDGTGIGFITRHHTIYMTVVDEAQKGEPKFPVLWLLDLSCPLEGYKYAKKSIDDVGASFAVGDASDMEADLKQYEKDMNEKFEQLEKDIAKKKQEMEAKEKKEKMKQPA